MVMMTRAMVMMMIVILKMMMMMGNLVRFCQQGAHCQTTLNIHGFWGWFYGQLLKFGSDIIITSKDV